MAGHPYLDLVSARASAPARAWLEARFDRLEPADFALAYTGAGRRLGPAPVEPTQQEEARLAAAGLPSPRGWPLSMLGRAGLLALACAGLPRPARVQLVEGTYRTGDNDERAAVLQALSILPEPEAFVALGVDACRSHVQSVFEAIACENPYPSRHFPDLNFNQLVLKALFTGVAVRRIQGLGERRSPELSRMAEAYASERRAAGRSVPADLHLVIGTEVTGAEVTGADPSPSETTQ